MCITFMSTLSHSSYTNLYPSSPPPPLALTPNAVHPSGLYIAVGFASKIDVFSVLMDDLEVGDVTTPMPLTLTLT